MTRVVFALVFLASAAVFADGRMAGQLVDEKRDEQVALRAKRRQYPGGPDESDLKVQAQLVAPVRKMNPVITDDTATGDAPASNGETD